jgi:hypothetical protein
MGVYKKNNNAACCLAVETSVARLLNSSTIAGYIKNQDLIFAAN